MKSKDENMDMEYEKFKEEYKYYCEDNDEEIQGEFDIISNFQTNIRGVKVRGVYDNQRAANIRAQVLQKMDNSFHVYVGQVGFWLPWEPNANKVQEQEYLEEGLNKLVKEYNKNQVKKDIFYEEKKAEQKKEAIKHAMEQEKKNKEEKARLLEESKKLAEEKVEKESVSDNIQVEISDNNGEDTVETTSSQAENTAEPLETTSSPAETTSSPDETTATSVENTTEPVETHNDVEENSIRDSLEKMDPWMERKIGENK